MSTRRRGLVWVLPTLFLAASALAQPTPMFDPAGGPWSISRVGVIDDDGTPGPSPGDTPIWPEWEDRMAGLLQFVVPGCGDAFVDGDSTGGAGMGILDQFTYNGMFLFDSFDMMNRPLGGSFDDGNQQGGIMGLDPDNDGEVEALELTNENVMMSFLFGFQFANTGGDGAPDFVSLGPLDQFLPSCGSVDTANAIWLPLANVTGGKSVVPDPDDNGVGDPEFLIAPPLGVGDSIPSVSQWGLLALVLGTLAASLQLLRTRL